MTTPGIVLRPTRSVVVIIESLSERDIAEGRSEGETLNAALRLADIWYRYYPISSYEDLVNVFSTLPDDIPNTVISVDGPKEPTVLIPYFHISAHGTQEGLRLTGGDFISWNKVRDLLIDFGRATGRLINDYCYFSICFSACEGAYARRVFYGNSPYPCIAIVGPEEPISWPDSTTAYLTFYHLAIHKDGFAPDVVPVMNQAAGLENVFRHYLAPT